MFVLSFSIIGSLLISKITHLGTAAPLVTKSAPSEDIVEETQHAICKINTKDIQTSANATVKRQLKGVCTTRQIERKFKQLEQKILSELNHIKVILGNEPIVTIKPSEYDYHYDENIVEKSFDNIGTENNDDIISVREDITREMSWARTEINQLNNTVYSLKGQNVYTYYWEIPKIRTILVKNGIHMRSPDFNVLGHQLCIQIYPNHLHSNYLGIQLRPNSNFLKKHKFSILDQFDTTKDINSQTLDGINNYELSYRVPYAKLEERNYLYKDAIVIKLTIYLNS